MSLYGYGVYISIELQSATVNKHSNCRGTYTERKRGEKKEGEIDNYYEHFLQNSGDKFQYLTEQSTSYKLQIQIHTQAIHICMYCLCRNGKIITIITKNYLSTNREEKEASRGGRQADTVEASSRYRYARRIR